MRHTSRQFACSVKSPTMSATTTTTAALASSSCSAELYEIPVHNAACAMPIAYSNSSAIMKSCCSSASVITYSDCDYYCLAVGQTVGELAECLIAASEAGQVWCNSNANATAASKSISSSTGTSIASNTGSSKTSASSSGSVQHAKLSIAALGVIGLFLSGSLLQSTLI
ncbi:hypothetical protein PMG11_06967 [Penicillium brasilianum]|uniref:Uncharacterized protein n=1 Tax=Penicillium brasilianum TaxID=104259 RepID=A0A0F7TSA1_PENBI|nr:hypothetical protein PMG11_06967 [Penicillium brasilianum]